MTGPPLWVARKDRPVTQEDPPIARWVFRWTCAGQRGRRWDQTGPLPVRVRPVTMLTTTTVRIGADGRDDDRADVERAVDRLRVEQDAGQEAADEGADDAEHDVSDDAETLVTLDDEPGEIPGDGAEDDPRDDAHAAYLRSPCAGLAPACWGSAPSRNPGMPSLLSVSTYRRTTTMARRVTST